MADLQLLINVVGQDNASGAFTAIAKNLGHVSERAQESVSPLRRLGENLSVFGLAMNGVNALSGAVNGLASSLTAPAQEMEAARARINAFTKDTNETEKILKAVRAEADKTPFSFGEMASAAASLGPTAKRAGVDLTSLLQTAEALNASDPAQGFEGAVMALREAMGGDFLSLRERFEVDTKEMSAAIKAGVPPIEAITAALGKQGINMDMVRGLAETTAGRMSTFSDMLEGIRRTAGEEILKGFGMGLDNVSNIIQDMLPEINELAKLFGQVISAAITLAANAFSVFAPILRDVIKVLADNAPEASFRLTVAMTQVGNAISNTAVVLKGLWDAAQPVIRIIGDNLRPIFVGLAAVLANVVIPMVITWATTTATAAAATVVALAPVVVPLVAIGVAAAALYAAWENNFLGIRDATDAMWLFIQPIFGMVADALNAFSREVAPEAGAAWANMTATAQSVWAALMEFFGPSFETFKAVWIEAWPIIQTAATGAITIVDTVIRTTWELLKTFILTVLKVLQGDWAGAWKEMHEGVSGAWKIIDDRVRDVLPKLKEFIGEQWDNVLAKNRELWNPENGTIPTLIREGWANMVTAIGNAITDILNKMGELAREAFEKAKEIGSKIIDGITQAVKDAAGNVGDAVKGVVEGAIRGAQDILNSWKPKLPSIPMPSLPGRGGGNVMGPMPAIEDAGGWVSPLSAPVTQEFGRTPFAIANPKAYPGGIHTGIDLGANQGVGVVAARTGRVDIAGWDNSGFGNLVAITHPGGFRTLYGHLSSIDVRPGQEVLSGQLIGKVGSTGFSTAPHLHFEIRENGQVTNPRQFVGFGGGGVVPGPLGAGTPIMAHGGEVVLRPDQAAAMGLGMRRAIGGGGGMSDEQMQRLAGYVAAAVAQAVSSMAVRLEGAGFSDAVVGAIDNGTRRGRLSQGVNEAFGGR